MIKSVKLRTKLKTKPFRYQRKGVQRIWHFDGNALLADEMGLGKTLQALMFAHELGEGPVLVICKAGGKWHWQREAWKHIHMRSEVLEGRTPPRHWSRSAPCVIINYDILKLWLPKLKKMRPILTIVDEGHKISNRATQQTKHTLSILKRSRHKIIISGTPLTNRPAELFPLINALRPDVFPSFHSYAERHCRPTLKPWGWEYKGATHLRELHKKLKRTCMIRRLKKNVLKDLPPKTRSVIPLDITKEDRKEYEEAEKNFIRWLSKKSKHLARKAAAAERLVKMGYLKRLAAKLKLKQVMDWIDNFLQESDEKLIIFGIHKAVLHEIYQRYKTKAVMVTGEVTGRKRQHAEDLFNHDKRYRLFIGNIEAAGEQWSCTSASTTVFVEIGWVPAKHIQAEDRTHGIKRGRKGFISQSYYLVTRGTIEEDLCKIVQTKQGILDQTLDGAGEDDSDLNIFDMLSDALTKKPRLKRRVA